MSPRVMTCTNCGAPVQFGDAFCAYCRSPLTWPGGVPEIGRGPGLASSDFGTQGQLVTAEPRKPCWGAMGPPVRNGCAVLRFTSWDSGTVSLLFRTNRNSKDEDGYCSAYEVRADPAYRAFQLTSVLWHEDIDDVRVVRPFENEATLAGAGQPNEIEARFADSILQIAINGRLVTTAIDTMFGFGSIGWRVRAPLSAPARATLHALDLFEHQ